VETATLRTLLEEDPAGPVRSEAVAALVARRKAAALPAAVAVLTSDPDPATRRAAAEAAAGLGAAAVPALRAAVWSPDATPERVAGPLAALALAGPEGVAELKRTAHEHPQQKIRGVARLLLGRDPQDPH
jgi:HEAT repeat protein